MKLDKMFFIVLVLHAPFCWAASPKHVTFLDSEAETMPEQKQTDQPSAKQLSPKITPDRIAQMLAQSNKRGSQRKPLQRTPQEAYAQAVTDLKQTKARERVLAQGGGPMHNPNKAKQVEAVAAAHAKRMPAGCALCGWLSAWCIRLCGCCCYNPSDKEINEARRTMQFKTLCPDKDGLPLGDL